MRRLIGIVLIAIIAVAAIGVIWMNMPDENGDDNGIDIPDIFKPEEPQQIVREISGDEAYAIAQNNSNNPDFAILDVRPWVQYIFEHVSGALSESLPVTPSDLVDYDKNGTYIVYCNNGIAAGQAVSVMEEEGFMEVYNMGSIDAWKDAGYDTKYFFERE